MSDPVKRMITLARANLLFNNAFFGNIATRLTPKEVDWCPTAATDGRHIYYNRDFILSLSKEELIFLIAHEVMHCVFDHFGRRGTRESGLWNMANDYVINSMLVDEQIGKMPTEVQVKDDKSKGGISQRVGLYDPKYKGWASEEVYSDLEDNSAQVCLGLDDHLDMGDDNGKGKGNKGGANVRIVGDGDGPPDISKEELDEIRNEIKTCILDAAAAVQNAGQIPAAVRQIIKDLVEPKLDWRQMLDLHIKSLIKNDYTFARPCRKAWDMGVVLPGMNYDECVEVHIGIDLSGSIGDEQRRDFLSEIMGIMEQFVDYKVHVWTFDTQVYDHMIYTSNNGDELVDHPLRGGGGTDFMCNWDFMREKDMVPDKFIMFTDGYPCGEWGEPEYCDTLFIIHNEHNPNIESPFGVSVYYDQETKD